MNNKEISSLAEREFRILIVTVLQRLENRMEKMQQAFNTVNTITNDIEEITNKQTDRLVEITAEEQNTGKGMKIIEDIIKDFWDNIKCTKIQVIGVPEEEEKKKGTEKCFEEIIVENFTIIGKEIVKF